MRFYVTSLVVISIVTSLSLKFQGIDASWGEAFLDGTFHVVSYASSTGFGVSDNAVWPMLPCFLLMVMSLVCGCAGSCSGGMKTDRVIVLIKAIHMQIQKTLYPSSVFEVRVGRRVLHDEEIYPQILYLAIYALLIGLSTVLCLLIGDPNGHALTGSISTLGNVGASLGSIGSMGNYGAEPNTLKIIFSVNMFLGRVEIYPIFAVLSSIFNRKYQGRA